MKRRGSVLILVLWALFILSALAVAISGYVHSQIAIAERLSEKPRGYYLAKAAVARAIAEIRIQPEKDYEALHNGWADNAAIFKEVKFGDGVYSIVKSDIPPGDSSELKYGLSDEESKININKAPVDILEGLLTEAGGMAPEDAESVAACMVNWRSPEDQSLKEGAGAFHYAALERPYKCKNAPMEALEELLLVKGMTKKVFDKVKDHATVYGDRAVNINTAGETVLRSLGMEDKLAQKIIRFRQTDVFEDTAQITGLLSKKESLSADESGKINNLVSSGLLSVNSDNFGGIAVGRVGKRPGSPEAKITFVFDRKNGALRYWRE